MEHLAWFDAPRGERRFLSGQVGPNFGWPGGGRQMHVPDPSILQQVNQGERDRSTTAQGPRCTDARRMENGRPAPLFGELPRPGTRSEINGERPAGSARGGSSRLPDIRPVADVTSAGRRALELHGAHKETGRLVADGCAVRRQCEHGYPGLRRDLSVKALPTTWSGGEPSVQNAGFTGVFDQRLPAYRGWAAPQTSSTGEVFRAGGDQTCVPGVRDHVDDDLTTHAGAG